MLASWKSRAQVAATVTAMNLRSFAAFAFCGIALLAHAGDRRLETLLLLPEPKVMKNELSISPEGAELTVFTPARELADTPGIMAYPVEEFKKLGISVETFAERARKAADKRLATLKPELIKDAEGKVQYAVYRSEQPLMASLIVAPSLPGLFEGLFGEDLWAALPDRHSLFIFPAKPEVLGEFAADLADRYQTDPRAASPEIFRLRKGVPPKVVGSFVE